MRPRARSAAEYESCQRWCRLSPCPGACTVGRSGGHLWRERAHRQRRTADRHSRPASVAPPDSLGSALHAETSRGTRPNRGGSRGERRDLGRGGSPLYIVVGGAKWIALFYG